MSKNLNIELTLPDGKTFSDLNDAHLSDWDEAVAQQVEPGLSYVGRREGILHSTVQALRDSFDLLRKRAEEMTVWPELNNVFSTEPYKGNRQSQRDLYNGAYLEELEAGIKQHEGKLSFPRFAVETTETLNRLYAQMGESILDDVSLLIRRETFDPDAVFILIESAKEKGFFSETQYQKIRQEWLKQKTLRIDTETEISSRQVRDELAAVLTNVELVRPDDERELPPIFYCDDEYAKFTPRPPFTDFVDLIDLNPGDTVWIEGDGGSYTIKKLANGLIKMWATYVQRKKQEEREQYPQNYPLDALILPAGSVWIIDQDDYRDHNFPELSDAKHPAHRGILALVQGKRFGVFLPGVENEAFPAFAPNGITEGNRSVISWAPSAIRSIVLKSIAVQRASEK